jgi:hypothetical protein
MTKRVTLADGNEVGLRDKLGLAAGIEIQATVRGLIGQPDAVIVAALVEAYVRHGIESWTFTDEDGAPVPVTPETIQSMVLDDFTLATPVAEAADALYEDAVLGPLVRAAANSSPTTPTESSTSPMDSGSDENPTQSSPSSTSDSPTDDTETTSSLPDGVYKFSRTDPMDQLRDAG